jgi:hypothetical protein
MCTLRETAARNNVDRWVENVLQTLTTLPHGGQSRALKERARTMPTPSVVTVPSLCTSSVTE